MPVTAELHRHLVHGAPPASDLLGHPPPGPVGQGQPGRGDGQVLHRPRHDGAGDLHAHQPMLAPDQPRLAAEGGEIDEFDLGTLFHPGRLPTAPTGPSSVPHLDVHPQRSTPSGVDHAEHDHRRQSDQQLAHARRVHFHRGSPELGDLDTVKFAEPLSRVRDALHPA